VAVGFIMEFYGFAPENYDAVGNQIGWPENWPEGLTFHVAGPSDDGMRLVEIWDSREQRERWMEGTIQPAIQEAAGDVAAASPPPRVTEFEVHAQETR
jgi:hypothetical protein